MRIKPGTKVKLVTVEGVPLDNPIPGTVTDYKERTDCVEVLHDGHDGNPDLPVGTMGIDFWPTHEVEIVEGA